MKRALLALALAASAASCQSTGQDINDHWNASSAAPRAARFFLGYDSEKDGEYRDFAWERKQSINLTLRRHFLHHNPDNPNHAEWSGRYAGRPDNSFLPNPVSFIHLEGLLLGFAATGGGGSFVVLPIDSILGVLEDGGGKEFYDGIGNSFGAFLGPLIKELPNGETQVETSVITASFPIDGLGEDLDGEFVSGVSLIGQTSSAAE
ncbi:MAG: hypothetical protein ACI8QC_001401 [Planctomycetota bacterium]|jgi:hypothetical protein